MACSVFMTDWGEVKLSPIEAEQCRKWEWVASVPDGVAKDAQLMRTVLQARKNLRLKLADIERVAKWKYERESVS